jgi:DNA polymerase-3 subunit gamma/tau
VLALTSLTVATAAVDRRGNSSDSAVRVVAVAPAPDAPAQALYRRYRPETFEDVVGQEHVTLPLQQALRSQRVHHAYLFSGPRGCGKTTSARILARCLNCANGPTPTPCGVCDSCVALARGGPGSLDVIEIDAASHGGVDDARDLRDRAFFSPASSRYKIYVIDEAHMVTPGGFNALLKLVEEPPEHVKFVFATTEPDKVIGTIRSRTHHYPFRLVPPGQLRDYLGWICEREQVPVEQGVLPLVVRAGRGSVRDALSVLDQLIAGSGEEGVSCELATALLGYTDAALLDDTVEAFAAADGAAVFGIIDSVVEAGHDPKRFVEDLLERLRDLLILDAVGEAAGAILREVSADQVERMRQQAARFGAAELSRAADIVNTGLTEMRGATAPRLHLELICARVLLPSAEDDPRSLQARLDRIERRLEIAGSVPAATAPEPAPAAAPATAPAPAKPAKSEPGAGEPQRAGAGRPTLDRPRSAGQPGPNPAPTPTSTPTPEAGSGSIDATSLRRSWPDVVERVRTTRRVTWTLISQYAAVLGVDGKRLLLGFSNGNVRSNFDNGTHPEIVRQALLDVVGVDLQVEAIVDPAAPGAAPVRREQPAPARSGPDTSAARSGPPRPEQPSPPGPVVSAAGPREPGDPDLHGTNDAGPDPRRAAPASVPAYPAPSEDDAPSPDDEDADPGLTGRDLLARELGATVIREEDHA